ncbi:hypothetical protein C943_02720 [Mariniradius saccharolyticus AK6]|uniref:Uncharacterized protein n=1 Tax=Mariniradius saccharolyticus AK6 TaxID=1239962 RepID=M7X0F0_9BACT|nr:hypothetical protein C943_02720 [Mariniradius saccharolyticus AK6]
MGEIFTFGAVAGGKSPSMSPFGARSLQITNDPEFLTLMVAELPVRFKLP